MAEYVDKTELWKKMTQKYDEVADILEVIDELPTIEIVHCEKCEYYYEGDFCSKMGVFLDNDFFCKAGAEKLHSERKE